MDKNLMNLFKIFSCLYTFSSLSCSFFCSSSSSFFFPPPPSNSLPFPLSLVLLSLLFTPNISSSKHSNRSKRWKGRSQTKSDPLVGWVLGGELIALCRKITKPNSEQRWCISEMLRPLVKGKQHNVENVSIDKKL